MSNSLWPRGLQPARLLCPPLFPGVWFVLWIGDALFSSYPLSPPSPFASNLSQPQGLFQWIGLFESLGHSIGASASASNEYSGLISFRIDCFDLLAVQGTLKSLLQHLSSKVSILQHSAFFMVQPSRLYMTTGKNIALTIWNLVSKVMSLLFNTLSRFVIALQHVWDAKKKKKTGHWF